MFQARKFSRALVATMLCATGASALVSVSAAGAAGINAAPAGHVKLTGQGQVFAGRPTVLLPRSDGSVVVGLEQRFTAARFRSVVKTGALGSFAYGNFSTDQLFDSVELPGGKILSVLGAPAAPANDTFERVLASGVSDETLGAGGKKAFSIARSTDVVKLGVQSDGKIIVAYDTKTGIGLSRFTSDGAVDPSFGTAGVTTDDLVGTKVGKPFLGAMAVRGDGTIAVGGRQSGSWFVERFSADGKRINISTDNGLAYGPSLGDGGQAVHRIVATSAGDLVVTIENTPPPGRGFASTSVMKIKGNGVVDTSWGETGQRIFAGSAGAPTDLDLLTDEVVQVLTSSGILIRLDAKGRNDRSFDGDGVAQVPTSLVTYTGAAVTQDGRIIVAGRNDTNAVWVEVTLENGYWMLGRDGKVYGFGQAKDRGAAAIARTAQAVDLEPSSSGDGYWILGSDGAISMHGDAANLGASVALRTGESATSIAATPDNQGLFVFTSAGRAISLGSAKHFGDMSNVRLNGPVLDSVVTPSGNGYYMVASDGGVFAFGDATFYGSMGAVRLNKPVESLVPSASGKGYWLVASDGGIFAFGDAVFKGSMGNVRLNKPITGMVRYGNGYLMVAEDGGVFTFSDQAFLGSLGNNPPAVPITNIAPLP